MRQLMRTLILPAAAAVLVAAGCSSGASLKLVKGKVTYNGEPLGAADLEFVPKEDRTIGSFMGQADPDGTFEIKIGKGTGRNAKPGSFIVLVTKGKGFGAPPPEVAAGLSEEERVHALMKAGPGGPGSVGSGSGNYGILPDKYANKATSPFKFDLSEGENDIGTLKLDGPALKKK